MKKMMLIVLVLTVCLVMISIPVSADVSSKFDVHLYGRVKVDFNYDTAQFTSYNDWLGVVEENATNDSTNFNPRDTRFGAKVTHTNGDVTANACFEIDFYGDNNVNNLIPRMRLGYIDVGNTATGTSLRMGQDWIPVAQLNPATIDFGILSAAGNLWWRVPQVTLRQKIEDVEFLLSAMKHRRTTTGEQERMPWILGRVAYNMGGHLVALGGGYRSGEIGGENVDRSLVALEFTCNLEPILLKAEGFWGKGIDGEFLRYDMGINNTGAKPEEIEVLGGFVSLTAKATDNITVSAGYGIDDPKNDDLEGMPLTENNRQFSRNAIAFLNSWYQVTEGLKIGAEAMYAKTERCRTGVRPHEIDEGMRYTLSAFYSF